MRHTRSLPPDPFTFTEAAGLGYSRRELAAAVSLGEVRRVLRGVYVPGDWPDDLEHRARAGARLLGAEQVFVDRTAAWLHGVDVLGYAELELVPPVETAVLSGRRASRLQGVRGRSRDLASRDVMVVHGAAVTTPLRTALDLACNLRAPEAVGALDAFGRLHGVGRVDLLAELGRFKGRRGVVQARRLIGMMDPRAESARESRLRLAIHDAGLPTPHSQYAVFLEGHHFRVDFAYPAHRIAIEYDGEEFHDGEQQRQYDEFRRSLLRAAGWTLIVVRKGDFTGPRLQAWVIQVWEALESRYTSLRW